jgi:ABC-2 type transport system permease protein
MRDWISVARWEVMRLLKRKDFIISTLLIPVMVTAGITVGQLLKKRSDAKVTKIAMIREDGAPVTLPALKGFEWLAPDSGDRTREGLARLVNEKKVDGALVVPEDLAAADTMDALVRWPRQDWVDRLESHVLGEARIARANAAGLSDSALARLDRPIQLEERVTQAAAAGGRADRLIALGTIVLIVMALFTAISYMGIGISGEKQARVTEVVVSAISPQSWIDGKIAAYTLAGLMQAVVWAITAFGAIVFFMATMPEALNPVALVISLAFAAGGFAFYVAMFAMIMATIKDLQSTTKFQAYLIFIPFTPFMFMTPALSNPDALWVVVLSQLPIFSPMLVPARFAIGGIAPWEIGLAFVLLLVGFQLMRRAAGAAFRIGMLMYGKELSLPELWRWSKTG